jgi:serine/threonine protein kinase
MNDQRAHATDGEALLLLREALDLDTQAERDSLLDARCSERPQLRARVRDLLERSSMELTETGADVRDALIGSRLGAYRVLERIGRGGMGVVYRGERQDADFTQEVALKLIRRGFDFDDVHARFLQERRILARLSHPNLARFIDGGVAADGRPWFALEFVRGETITQWCDTHRLDLRARMRLFLDVCAAVQYAHTQLVVHRDLKPGNVLIDDTGAVRLLDFGIAKLLSGEDDSETTQTIIGQRALTPEYAAPEQFNGQPVGVAGDVYSLGVLAYVLISGVVPCAVDRRDLAQARRHVLELPPQPLTQAIVRVSPTEAASAGNAADTVTQIEEHASATPAQRLHARSTSLRAYRKLVRGDVSRILETALAKEPQHRYVTVAAFADDLDRWLRGVPVRVSGRRFGYRAGKFIRRNAVAVAIAAALVLGLIATSAWALRSAYHERLQREAALREVARGNAVNDYVMLMFRDAGQQGDPSQLTARDVLRSGASQIAARFADRPETGQRIALTLAGLYARLGDTEGATPLLEQVIAWPGIEKNPDVQADAQQQLAEVEYFRSHIARARSLLEQARAWWSKDPALHAKVLNESLITRSQIERAEGHMDASIATLEEAIAERRVLLGAPDRDLGIALGTLSVSLIQSGRNTEAMQRADDALDVFKAIGEANSVAALAALSNRGTAAMNAGQYEAAERDLRQAVELRERLYGPSPELAQVQNNLGLSLLRQHRVDEAIALFESGLAMAISRGGETSRYALGLRGNLAEAYVLTGRVDAAVPLAETAVRIAHEQFGDRNFFVGTAKRARAAVRIAQGRNAEARQDLDDATVIFTALGKGGEALLKTLTPLREKLAP